MPKFHPYTHQNGRTGYIFQCPGCGGAHYVLTSGPDRPRWKVTGVEKDKPTVRPSILARAGRNVCHSFVDDGRIRFLGDCTHAFAGDTVEIPDFEE